MDSPLASMRMANEARLLKSPVPVNSAHLSFAQRKAQLARASTPHLVEGDQYTLRDIDRAPPGDPSSRPRRTQSRPEIAKQRSQYFDQVFSAKGTEDPAKERIRNETVVVAEVKTNVIVRTPSLSSPFQPGRESTRR